MMMMMMMMMKVKLRVISDSLGLIQLIYAKVVH